MQAPAKNFGIDYGDADFYFELIRSLAYVAKEFDVTALLDKNINKLAKTNAIKKLSNHF